MSQRNLSSSHQDPDPGSEGSECRGFGAQLFRILRLIPKGVLQVWQSLPWLAVTVNKVFSRCIGPNQQKKERVAKPDPRLATLPSSPDLMLNSDVLATGAVGESHSGCNPWTTEGHC